MNTACRVIALSIIATAVFTGCASDGRPKPSVITPQQKQEFVDLLATLPTEGQFYAKEAVHRAKPYLPHLLSLTESDLKDREMYPFLTLSSDMIQDADNLVYVTANFGQIRHPLIKIFWGLAILDRDRPATEIVEYLRTALSDAAQTKQLISFVGPGGIREIQERLVELDSGGRPNPLDPPELDTTLAPSPDGHAVVLRLVSTIPIPAFPKHSETFTYEAEACAFGPDHRLSCLRRTKFGGELCVVDPAKNAVEYIPLPQPEGLKQEFAHTPYFGDAHLCTNNGGDMLAWWTLGGNGDHAVGLCVAGEKAFTVTRTPQNIPIYMANSRAILSPDGAWYMLVWNASMPSDLEVFVYRVTNKALLEQVTQFRGPGHHDINVLDAAFLDNSTLAVVWTDVDLNKRTRAHVWTSQFDLGTKQWSSRRLLAHSGKFTSTSSSRIFVFADSSINYLWHLSPGGIYCLREGSKKPIKVAPVDSGFQALQVNRSIIVIYTRGAEPSRLFFRVIQDGMPGPETSIELSGERQYPLNAAYIIAGSAGDNKVWFIDSSGKTAYLLELDPGNGK